MKLHGRDGAKQAAFVFWSTLVLPPAFLFLFGPAAYFLVALFFVVLNYFLRFEGLQSFREEFLNVFKFRSRQWLSRVLEGSASHSLYAIAFILAVTVALFAWFADGIKEQNFFLVLGSLTYVAALILAQDLLYQRMQELVEPTRRHYVAWGSQPYFRDVETAEDYLKLIERYKDPNEVRRALDENKLVLGDKIIKTPNILPLIAPLARSDFNAKTFDLLVASDTEFRYDPKAKGKVPLKHAGLHWELVRVMAQAVRPELEFNLMRRSVPAWNVEGMAKDLNDLYNDELKTRSQDMVFNATSGTAAASAATMLVALRGAAEALYIRQDREDLPLDQRVVFIQLHPLKLVEFFSDDLPADVQPGEPGRGG